MQQAGGGDAHVVIERTLGDGGGRSVDRLPRSVIQRYVERELSRVFGAIDPAQLRPVRSDLTVQARIGWTAFEVRTAAGSGVGAAAVVDASTGLIELRTHDELVGQGWIPVAAEESEAVLKVLSARYPTLQAGLQALLQRTA